MKWLVLLALVGGVAHADMAMPDPAPVRFCARGQTLDQVEACLRKLGKPALVHTFADARLYRLVMPNGDGTTADVGLSLYVHRGGAWQLGGTFEARGLTYEVLGAAPVVAGKHAGYRIDIGEATHIFTFVDGGHTQVPALLTHHEVLLCSGDNARCVDAVVECDVLVRGGAVFAFHGALSIDDNRVHVAGDRDHAGASCQYPETMFLGWTQAQ